MDLSSLLNSIGGPKVAAGIAGALLFAIVLAKVLMRPKESPHTTRKVCPACGWGGSVSKYQPKCPSCGKPIA